jgi:hypothetical protein
LPAGRPPKPIEQHRRTGTLRPVRHGARAGLAVVAPVDSLPYELEAADVFRHIMEAGAPWFAATDSIRLSMLRESLEERARLMDHAEASSESRRQLRELNKEISEWLSMLGFDPAARSRLGLAEVKAQSVLEKMQAEKDKR